MITAPGSKQVWAVYNMYDGKTRASAVEWTGKSWAAPTLFPPGVTVQAAVAPSPSAVFALGHSDDLMSSQTLRYNGKAWKVVPSPSPEQSGLSGVAAASGRSAWAVGDTYSATSQGQALIERWNGKRWQQVRSPAPGAGLHSVSATSTRNAWVVGFGGSGGGYLILHWNGSSLKQVASPKSSGFLPFPDAVAATSARNAWVVGSTSQSSTLIERWTGSSWTRQASPSGSPTWPHPPTTTTSCSNCIGLPI